MSLNIPVYYDMNNKSTNQGEGGSAYSKIRPKWHETGFQQQYQKELNEALKAISPYLIDSTHITHENVEHYVNNIYEKMCLAIHNATRCYYLGTILEPGNGGKHTGSRKMATQRAFYSLQGAGVNYGGVQPETAVKIYRVAVGSVLTYGCSAIYMSQSNMKSLNIIQNNQLKYIVGLRRNVRSTPLLSALSLLPDNISVALNSLKLFKSCLQSSSSASVFYKLLMKKEKHVDLEKTLYGRVHSFLLENSSYINNYLLNDGIDLQLRQKFLCTIR